MDLSPTPHSPRERAFDEHVLALVEIGRRVPPMGTWSGHRSHRVLVAMMLRALDTAESVVTLRQVGNEADGLALSRVLFDHVATYCWLVSGDAEERFRRWWKNELAAARTLANAADRIPALRRRLAEADAPPPSETPPHVEAVAGLPPVEVLAREADAAWSVPVRAALEGGSVAELPGLDDLYVLSFKLNSQFVHATGSFTETHLRTDPRAPGVFALEAPGRIVGLAAFEQVLTLLAWGLAVTHLTWGWPAIEPVRARLASYAAARATLP